MAEPLVGFFGIRLEHRSEPLLPRRKFVRRMTRSGVVGASIVLVSLVIGVIGYHVLGQLTWINALVNASMILGGMGPVDPITTVAGKWFESIYALYSGVALLTSVGIFLAPALHRLLHRLHLEQAGRI
ncbi:MAG: hypothetical protein ACRENS_13895 [Candidatus Eiseniibacteriota bacterium]